MDILQLLENADAFHQDKHFVYSSGDHGHQYINLRILRQPEYQNELAILSLILIEKIVEEANIDVNEPVTIVGPDTLGAIIARTAAIKHNSAYGTAFSTLRLKAEMHSDGSKVFIWDDDDPAQLIRNSQIVYVDDLMNAGSTLEQARTLIYMHGDIHAVGVIADRSEMTAEQLAVPYFTSLLRVQLERYSKEECPYCWLNIPIVTNLGHGQLFQKRYPSYGGKFVTL